MNGIDLIGMLTAIVGTLLLLMISIVGFFLRALYKDLRDNIMKTNEQEGRLNTMDETHKQEISALKEVNNNKLDSLEKTTEVQISGMAESVNNLTKTLDNHIKTTEKRMQQKDATQELLTKLLDKITESN